MNDEEFFRWYGAWDALDPAGVRDFMAGFDRPWWVVGGWSIEVFTGVAREHDDLDISMLACDAAAFRDFLGDRCTPWTVGSGALRPFNEKFPHVEPDGQLWVRTGSDQPWILDIPLTPDTDGLWTNKRWPAHTAPIEDVTWVVDDVRYLKPEVTLMMKARLDRAKDRADLAVAWPLLGRAEQVWVRHAIEQAHPGHAWLDLVTGLLDEVPRRGES